MEPPSTSAPQRSPPPPVQAVAGGGSTGCTPHLKRVLKSYQAAAVSSLQGPPGCLMAAAGGSPGSGDDDDLPAPAPFPIQQPPLLTPPDQSRCSERSETQLESYSISCFSVGGERRLCLPQILSTVLAEFSQPQINGVCDELHIFCSRCNAEQLDVLKATGVIPSSAPSCGLITKSDAERLCAALIHQGTPPQGPGGPDPVPVYHECFGGATGSLVLDAYLGPCSPSVRCRECGLLFAPRRFVCHAHRARESRTCHWGFDSAHWRHYLLLDDREPNADLEAAADVLAQFKAKFTDDVAKRKQSPPPSEVRKKKLLRAAEEPATLSPFMVMGSDPALWHQSQPARPSAFTPWSSIVPGSKERALGKEHHPHLPPLPMGTPLPLYPKNNLPYSMLAYFPPGVDMAGLHKLDPGIVKPDPDRPELCLLPPTAVAAAAAAAAAAQQRHLLKKQIQAEGEVVTKKEAPRSRTGSVDSGQGGPPAKAVNGRVSADTDETMSNSSLSTLSGVEEVGLPAEDCLRGDACPGVPPELEGLWGAFERHSVGDSAREDIVREVQLLLTAACQQRRLLGMGLAGYRLLLHQQQAARQESERLPCKPGPGLGGDALPLGPSPQSTKSVSPPPPSPPHPPSSSCDAKAPLAGDDRGEPMVLSREMPRPLVEKTLPLLAT